MLNNCVINDVPFDLKYRIVLSGNIEKWIHSKSEIKKLPDGEKYLVGFFKDITSEIEQQKKVEESEHYVRLLFDTIQEGIALNEAIYDEEGNIVDYKILIANDAFDRNSEFDAKDVIGKTASEAYHMDQKFIKAWWDSQKDAKFPVYTEMFRPDAEKWAYISTSQVVNKKFVTAFFDISENKKKELLLEESEKKYKNLVENSITGVAQITKDRFLFANTCFLNLLGFDSLKDVNDKSLFDFLSEADKKRLNVILDSTHPESNKQNHLTQIKIKNDSGTDKDVEMLISATNTNPETTWQCIISDISEKTNLIKKAKRVSTDAIYLSRKLELFSEIESQLDSIITNNKLEKNTFQHLYERIKQDKNIEQLWTVFQYNFEIIYNDFFKKLNEITPSLTQQELKHCAFIKMNFETKEIATLFHVKPSSIQTSRVRLKKKLNLKADQDLINFIISL
jgi:PAS domain S-box-containing protein